MGPAYTFGVNGPAPVQYGMTERIDFTWMASADTKSPNVGSLEIFAFDFEKEFAKPIGNNWTFGVIAAHRDPVVGRPDKRWNVVASWIGLFVRPGTQIEFSRGEWLEPRGRFRSDAGVGLQFVDLEQGGDVRRARGRVLAGESAVDGGPRRGVLGPGG
ncbi:MAG: hypothetical protein QM820_43270 [Minicystis sp.]